MLRLLVLLIAVGALGGCTASSPAAGDGGPGGDATGVDAAAPCPDPPGSACNPIVIDRFGFADARDTTLSGADDIDAYACAPQTDESGPEVHYLLVVDEAGTVTATLDEDPGVDVDLQLLSSPQPDPERCLARHNNTLSVGLLPGSYRLLVDTYVAGGVPQGGGYRLALEWRAPRAAPLGTMWNTYYYLAEERDHPGTVDTAIYDASCQPLVYSTAGFYDSLCIEGSGLLADGRLLGWATACTDSCPAARLCQPFGYRGCFQFQDRAVYPWSVGAAGRALIPDRSIAVDRAFVPLGSILYLEELDGVVPPGGSVPHDGCLRADDVGGAINDNHFDFFAGTRVRALLWSDIFPSFTDFTAHVDHPRCYGVVFE